MLTTEIGNRVLLDRLPLRLPLLFLSVIDYSSIKNELIFILKFGLKLLQLSMK